MYTDFELQGIEEDKLNSKAYQTIMDRIKMEEAAASVSNGLYRENDDLEYALFCNQFGLIFIYIFFCREFGNSEVNNVAKNKTTTPINYPRANMADSGNYVSRIQNATSNVMGRISGLGRGVGHISGVANKFLNNL